MENGDLKNLKTLIETLTLSGLNSLNEDIFKSVKKICKSCQGSIPVAYNIVLTQLKKKNSQVRLSAFQICKELFKRSVLFRENVLKDLTLIFELTAEINAKKLPPPKSAAASLKSLAISTLKEWVEEFGESYKKLKVAFDYFKRCKKVDFNTLQFCNSAEQERHYQRINEEKIQKVSEEFNSNESDIQMTITSLSNCLSLLLPPAEEFFVPEVALQETSIAQSVTVGADKNRTTFSDSSNDNLKNIEDGENYFSGSGSSLRQFGVPSNYNLTVQLNLRDKFKVFKTEENNTVIENAKDCVRLINNRYLPTVKKWIKIYCKCSNRGNGIKKIIDLKEKLENILNKYNLIVIDGENNEENNENNENNSDDDFEEVKKDGYEEFVNFSEELMLECLKEKSASGSNKDIKTSQNSVKETMPCASTSKSESEGESCSTSDSLDRKRKLLSIAPKLPYDIDLYHWEDEQLSTPTLISTKIDVDKFWGSAGSDDIHEIPNPEGVAALRTRVIEFTGTFEPVKWACRAPLPNGKLCPRKDRFKCPFHGKIVARDETGIIQNKEDEKAVEPSSRISSVPDFQDPVFLNDLQAATGVDLKIPERKARKRKSENENLTLKKMKTSSGALKLLETKKLPGLVDVVKRQNNAYTRLSKKIFNRSALRRVSATLNKLDRKKFVDKFGDQFNYI